MTLHPICDKAPTLKIEGGRFIPERGEWRGDILVWGTRILAIDGTDVWPIPDDFSPVPGTAYRYEVQASGPRGTATVWSEDVVG